VDFNGEKRGREEKDRGGGKKPGSAGGRHFSLRLLDTAGLVNVSGPDHRTVFFDVFRSISFPFYGEETILSLRAPGTSPGVPPSDQPTGPPPLRGLEDGLFAPQTAILRLDPVFLLRNNKT
jgi:hypothetical protein